jgi:hypothetical protein
MPILILGVALWWAAHLFKRIAPKARASMGQSGKGCRDGGADPVGRADDLGLSVPHPSGDVWWGPSPMMKGINNLLVLIAFYLFAASGMKTGITRRCVTRSWWASRFGLSGICW